MRLQAFEIYAAPFITARKVTCIQRGQARLGNEMIPCSNLTNTAILGGTVGQVCAGETMLGLLVKEVSKWLGSRLGRGSAWPGPMNTYRSQSCNWIGGFTVKSLQTRACGQRDGLSKSIILSVQFKDPMKDTGANLTCGRVARTPCRTKWGLRWEGRRRSKERSRCVGLRAGEWVWPEVHSRKPTGFYKGERTHLTGLTKPVARKAGTRV